MNDSYFHTHRVCMCPLHTAQILDEYFMIYGSKIKNLLKDISDHQVDAYSIDIELHERLYILWVGYFYELYVKPDSVYRIIWMFNPMDDCETLTGDVIFSKKIPAKFRFQCPRCNHIWTSKNGGVNAFICYHPVYTNTGQFTYSTNIYEFRFTFDRQKCTYCCFHESVSGSTYPHEVIKVLQHIRRRISVRPINNNMPYYGFHITLIDTSSSSSSPTPNFTNTKDYRSSIIPTSQVPSWTDEKPRDLSLQNRADTTIVSASKPNQSQQSVENESANHDQNEANSSDDKSHLPSTDLQQCLEKTGNSKICVTMTTIKLTNTNQQDQICTKVESRRTEHISRVREAQSPKNEDSNIKQYQHDLNRKPSVRISRYI
ncbi:unnamed protein product [Heterobilharzia americana]|nr:unnamed protein product [Heterobilharzia americana]